MQISLVYVHTSNIKDSRAISCKWWKLKLHLSWLKRPLPTFLTQFLQCVHCRQFFVWQARRWGQGCYRVGQTDSKLQLLEKQGRQSTNNVSLLGHFRAVSNSYSRLSIPENLYALEASKLLQNVNIQNIKGFQLDALRVFHCKVCSWSCLGSYTAQQIRQSIQFLVATGANPADEQERTWHHLPLEKTILHA